MMLSLRRVARVAEQVDAQDLKSCCQQWQYGFDSRPGHKKYLRKTPQCGVFLVNKL